MVGGDLPAGCEGCCVYKQTKDPKRSTGSEKMRPEQLKNADRTRLVGLEALYAVHPDLGFEPDNTPLIQAMVNAYETSPAEAKIVVEVSKDISGKDNPYKILRYVREFYCGRNTQIDDLIEELVDAYKQMSKHSF